MFIYVDADACPVKEEVYRVARRYAIKVYVVANTPLRVPAEALIELIVVRGGFDAADDWIVERVVLGDIVITADILLADRCLKARAYWVPRASRSPKMRSAMQSPLAPSSTCSASRERLAGALPHSPRRTARGSCPSSTRPFTPAAAIH